MEILVHGTKGGYKAKLFSTSNAPLSLGDVRNGVNTEYSVGQSLYSIEFLNGDYVFTKYFIVRDSLRSFATGNIAFSLFINSDKELSRKGADIFTLLENLSTHYRSNYLKENNINNGETTLIQEDWSFVNTILSDYKEQDKIQKEEVFKSGTKEAAYLYYKDEVELRDYFDKPFQEEYCDFKKVYFINEIFKGDLKNPLNVLSNSSEELKEIDLKNERYYLKSYDRSKGITIIANGKIVTDGKNNNLIRAKWLVEIKCSKDEICFESINEKGYLFDSNIQKYLDVKNKDIIIKYNTFIKPIVKTFSFEIINTNDEAINNAEILINNKLSKTIDGNKFECEFIGDEIKKRWVISVKKGDYSLVDNDFVPEKANEKTELILKKHKNIPIIIRDKKSNCELHDFEVLTKLTNSYQRIKQLEFVDEQILDIYKITIRKNGYQDEIIPNFQPYQQNKIETTLLENEIKNTEKQTENYKVSAGNHGRLKNNQSYSSNREDGSDVIHTIVNSKGYKFTHFLKKEDTLIAQYKKEETNFKKTLFISGLVVLALAISFGFWSIFKTDKANKSEYIGSDEIQIYVDGDILSLSKLNEYKDDLKLHKPEVKEINSGLLSWFMESEKQLDSTALMNWRNDTLNINEAINKRNLLNDKDFKKLKKLHFSSKQNNLIEVINKIDSTKYKDISKLLVNISDKTLTEIAVDIKSALKPKEPIIKKPQESDKETVGKGNEIVPTTPIKEKQKPTSVKPVKPIVVDSPDKNKNIEISNKLKGVSISVDELNNFKDENPKFKNSIQLYIDFLVKVQNNNDQKQDYDNLLKKVKADDILKNSELKSFLNSICSNSDSFEKFKSTSGKKSCKTLEKLKNKM